MPHFALFLASTLLVLGTTGRADDGGPIRFPADGGVLDVTSFGATPNDDTDDTAAIQAALDLHPSGNRIVYLPPGVFLISDTLTWPAGANSGVAHKRTILQGAGQNHSTLRIADATEGFRDPEKPRAAIWTGRSPAQRFRNAVRDLTLEIGAGNPGAIGLQFNASNQGTVRNVALRAAQDSGKIGLDLGHTNEIGPLLVKNLSVDGFEVGISTKWPVNSITFEDVTLRKQRRFGWWNYHQMIFVRGLVSENSVPALFNEKDSWGTVTLIDSKITGVQTDDRTPGILNQRQMYCRNVEIRGYARSIDHADKGRDKGDVESPGLIREDTSHANVVSQFRDLSDATFADAGSVPHLPAKDAPEIPWGSIDKDWANITDFGGDPEGRSDSTSALQAAIDSGARTVYLPAGGSFKLTGEVQIRGPVERITGLEGRFFADNTGRWKLVDDAHPEGLEDAPAVIIERLNGRSGMRGIEVVHESARTLVVRSTMGINVEGQGTGDIFLEDVAGQLNLHKPGQNAWCRQLNTEVKGTMLKNNGGKLWILGMKTEKVGTIIETVNGGITDAAGIFVYSNVPWEEGVPAFVIEDSTAILAGINERNFNRRPVNPWFRETQDGTTRERSERAWVYLSK